MLHYVTAVAPSFTHTGTRGSHPHRGTYARCARKRKASLSLSLSLSSRVFQSLSASFSRVLVLVLLGNGNWNSIRFIRACWERPLERGERKLGQAKLAATVNGTRRLLTALHRLLVMISPGF